MKAWRFRLVTTALGAAIVLVLATAPAGVAKRGDVRVAGKCTKASSSKLKLSEEDARIEVELEVDQNRVGVRWAVVLNQNGKRLARLTRTTKAPSGSFEARVLARNTSGTDVFTARATSPSGEVCTARASFG